MLTTRLNLELEKAYRKHYLPQDRAQLRFGVALWLISFLGFIYSDYLLFPLADSFWLLLGIRVGYGFFCAYLLIMLRRPELTLREFDQITLAWGIVTVLLDISISLIHPCNDLSVQINDLVGVISFYVFISSRMPARIIPAFTLTIFHLVMIFGCKDQLIGQAPLSLGYSFLVSNLVGIVFSRHYFDMRRAEFLARHESARTQVELRRLASTDPLTGVLNRRRLLELANDAFSRFRRYQRPFCILLMDLDGFKTVNDTFGHHQGDTVLIDFVRSVLVEKRDTDAFGRMGGDEFCLLLPETTPESAVAIAERILVRCGNLRLPNGEGEVHVTASIGITQALRSDAGLDSMFARADAALYHAKHSGRNRYEIN